MNESFQKHSGLLNVFSTLSAFNLNLELVAPECFNLQVSYYNKWIMIEALPLVLTAASLSIFVARYAYKKFIKRRTTRLTSHKPQLFGSTLVMMYYMFLYLTRTTLEVFNCVQSIPSDGYKYMVTIYARCFEPGGLHVSLFPFAVLSFIVYSMGYPLFVFRTLSKNRALVMEDQLLRAMKRGTSRRTNPNCWEFRKKYAKLYYQFKPRYWYWMVLIILRKFLIAGVGLLFRQYPTFQLACVMLILFVNYAFQVRNRPYMSAFETKLVLDEHVRYVIHETRVAKAKGEKFLQPAHLRLHDEGAQAVLLGDTASQSQTQSQSQTMGEYVWDHNTVEATLLFSACLVLLCGIMFESGQLGSPTEGYDNVAAQLLSFVTMLLIFASCVYFALVLVTELLVALRPDYFARINKVQKVFSQQSRTVRRGGNLPTGADHQQNDLHNDDDDDDEGLEMVAHMTANPLHQKQAEATAQALLARTRQQDALLALQEMKLRGLERKQTRRGSVTLTRRQSSVIGQPQLSQQSLPRDDDSSVASARAYFSDPESQPRALHSRSRARSSVVESLLAAVAEGDDVMLQPHDEAKSEATEPQTTGLLPPQPTVQEMETQRRPSLAKQRQPTESAMRPPGGPPPSATSPLPTAEAPDDSQKKRKKRAIQPPQAPPPAPSASSSASTGLVKRPPTKKP